VTHLTTKGGATNLNVGGSMNWKVEGQYSKNTKKRLGGSMHWNMGGQYSKFEN